MADLVGLFVPLGSMAFVFGIVWLITNYLAKRSDGGRMDELAAEVVRGQQELARQTEQLADRIGEIERLLKEV